MGETYFRESDLRIWVKNMFRNLTYEYGWNHIFRNLVLDLGLLSLDRWQETLGHLSQGTGWADIKTGRSPMARDHFRTPPDLKKGYHNPIWVLFLVVCDRKCLHDLECKDGYNCNQADEAGLQQGLLAMYWIPGCVGRGSLQSSSPASGNQKILEPGKFRNVES